MAELFGIRPWEMGRLRVSEVEAIRRDLEARSERERRMQQEMTRGNT